MKLGRRLTAVLAVGVAGLTVMTAGQAGAAPTILPKNGNLTYVEQGGVIVEPGGATSPYNIVTAGERQKFSPDGQRVAFFRQAAFSEDNGLWVRTLSSGSERRILLISGPKIALAWSPDATALAVSYGTKLLRVSVATGATSTIWAGPAGTQVDAPAWSPDGSRIAFSTGNAIKLVHPDGTNLRTLTSSPVGVINNYPDWSPDSQKIAFITNRYRGAEHSELVTLPRSGAGSPFRVSYKAYPQGIFYIGVAWSPDGKKIAALQFNRNALPDPEDTDERFKVRGYLPDGSHSYSLSGPIAGDDGPEGLDWAPKLS